MILVVPFILNNSLIFNHFNLSNIKAKIFTLKNAKNREMLKLFSKKAATISSNSTSTGRQQVLDYCVQIVRERDYENYLAGLLMPKEVQPRIFSILALNAELSTLRHKIRRHSGLTGIHQLTFWREALQTFGEQNDSGEWSNKTKNGKQRPLLPRQPVIVALKAFADPADLPHFVSLVEARQQTLGDRQFQSVELLEQNSRRLYGSLMMLQMNALHAFSKQNNKIVGEAEFPSTALKNAVDSMACSIGILTLLRATVLLLRDGVLLLPTDLTNLHGVTIEMAYREPNKLKEVIKDLCQIASTHLESARAQQRKFVPLSLRLALLTAGLRSDHLLGIFRGNNFNLLDARLQKPIPFSAWRLGWRDWRKHF